MRARLRVLAPIITATVMATAAPAQSVPSADTALEAKATATAWRLYRARKFREAATVFAGAADLAPRFSTRATLRLMSAQAALEAGGPAASMFKAVADSARALRATLAPAEQRVERAEGIADSIRANRRGHVDDAQRHARLLATVADSFAVTDRQIAAFADSLKGRDVPVGVREKLERLKASLAAARQAYDSACSAAAAAGLNVDADDEKRLGAALTELRAAELRRDSVRTPLDRAIEAGEYGSAAALFFASLESDSSGAATVATAARSAAIGALTDALAHFPRSAMRPRALVELAELFVRNADYPAAMARYDELLRDYPRAPDADAAAYSLGSVALLSQKPAEAMRAFAKVMSMDGSRYQAESFFRHGDSWFELAAGQAGAARRVMLARAAQSYRRAIALSRRDSEIHRAALYKLGRALEKDSTAAVPGPEPVPVRPREIPVFSRRIVTSVLDVPRGTR